jgi:hypothetical protein
VGLPVIKAKWCRLHFPGAAHAGATPCGVHRTSLAPVMSRQGGTGIGRNTQLNDTTVQYSHYNCVDHLPSQSHNPVATQTQHMLIMPSSLGGMAV